MRRVSTISGCRTSCVSKKGCRIRSRLLEAKGQKVALKEAMGSTQSIMVGPDGELLGASRPALGG
ncbi:hypothetical protein ACVXHB_07090 [Escherichia coli]